MSATSEAIWEQIRQIKVAIDEASSRGEDVTALMEQYRQLGDQYKTARKTLHESKGVLKG
jgi:hypothetical protein